MTWKTLHVTLEELPDTLNENVTNPAMFRIVPMPDGSVLVVWKTNGG